MLHIVIILSPLTLQLARREFTRPIQRAVEGGVAVVHRPKAGASNPAQDSNVKWVHPPRDSDILDAHNFATAFAPGVLKVRASTGISCI
jgi:hypothetical protein